jgi:hypothetical protein
MTRLPVLTTNSPERMNKRSCSEEPRIITTIPAGTALKLDVNSQLAGQLFVSNDALCREGIDQAPLSIGTKKFAQRGIVRTLTFWSPFFVGIPFSLPHHSCQWPEGENRRFFFRDRHLADFNLKGSDFNLEGRSGLSPGKIEHLLEQLVGMNDAMEIVQGWVSSYEEDRSPVHA